MNPELFGRATSYARGVLSELTHDDLRRPTPCEGWDVAEVVLHLADVVDALHSMLETGTLVLPRQPRTHEPNPVALVKERLATLTHAFLVAADTARVEHAATAGAVELTAHGWDIAVARNSSHRIPESLAEDVLALVSPVLSADMRGENFDAPVDVTSNAGASDRLVAFLGRAPSH